MKKFYSLYVLVAMFFVACTPQVIVTPKVTATLTLTPIPTPSLYPQFSALQKQIAESGRFTLNGADGLIYDGDTPIPGLHVTPDGVLSLTVDGQEVFLENDSYIFDNVSGITIDGYKLENGKWMTVESKVMQMATKVIEQYEIDLETVTVTEVDGVAHVTDNETGVEIVQIDTYVRRDENGVRDVYMIRFEINFAIDGIAVNSCDPTDFRPSKNGFLLAEYSDAFSEYKTKIEKELNYPMVNGANTYFLLIDRDKLCWGLVSNGKDLLYRDSEGVAQRLSLIPLTNEEVKAFQINR